MLGVDNNSSNSAQESSPSEESNDSSEDFSANKLSTSQKMAQNLAFHVHTVPEEAFEQGHKINPKKSPPNKLKISITEITIQFFHLFPKFENIVCSARRVITFRIPAVSFLRLPRSSPRPAGKHSCGMARQKGVKPQCWYARSWKDFFTTHHNQLSIIFKSFQEWKGVVFEEGQLLANGHQVVIDAFNLFASHAQSVVQNTFLTVQKNGKALTTDLQKHSLLSFFIHSSQNTLDIYQEEQNTK